MNTKFVLGLPRAKQVGLEHAKKNLRRCEPWLEVCKVPPAGGCVPAGGITLLWCGAQLQLVRLLAPPPVVGGQL